MPLEELFLQIALVIAVAAVLSFVMHRLRQPLIIAYILTGVIAGPGALALARSGSVFETMSQIGVAFLLFTVGLGLNWRSVKDVGGTALFTGAGQVLLTGLGAFALAHAVGFDPRTALYVSLALTFSSTIVIVKLLTDKEEMDTLYGRLAVGILLVQDFIAMFVLLGLAAFGAGASLQDTVTLSLLKVALLAPILWFVSLQVAPRLVGYAARSQELLFIFAVAWCFLVAAALAWLGFGIELGALVAGITLAGTAFVQEVQARVRPLRDFFLIIFFIVLGTQLQFGSLLGYGALLAAFSLFVLCVKPLLVLPVMRALGYHPRTAFLTGTTMAQVSEFSFIVLAAGMALGHIPAELMSVMTAVALVTIAVSSYFIEHNEVLYAFFQPLFRWKPRRLHHHKEEGSRTHPKLVMFGLHRVGSASLKTLHDLGRPYLIVDFDPNVVRALTELNEPVAYGDAADESFLAEIEADRVPFIVSTIPNVAVSLALLAFLRSKKSRGTAIVGARTAQEAALCYGAGAAYVIVPNILGGEKFRELLERKGMRARAWRLLGRQERDILTAYERSANT